MTTLRERVHSRFGPDLEDGNAVLEFVVLAVVMLVPLVYLMLAVLRVQGSAYAIAEATREASRAFVTADSSSQAYEKACIAATIAMQNQVSDGFDCATQLQISCAGHSACGSQLTPGETVRVEIELPVALPMLPTSVFGRPTAISLTSVHDEVVDEFRASR